MTRIVKRSVAGFCAVLFVTIAHRAQAGLNTWTTHGPDGGYVGVVEVLAVDPLTPSTLYAGTNAGGAFKSTDAGADWTAVNTGLPANAEVSALAVDPLTPTTLYAVTNGVGVFKSTDGAATWEATSVTGTTSGYSALAIDPLTPSTVYAVAGSESIFKSTDAGASWTGTSPACTATTLCAGSVHALAIDPLTPSTLYAGTGRGVYKTTDAGGTWNMAITIANVAALAIDPLTPSTVYGAAGSVFKSTDAGATWGPANTGLPNSDVFALAADPLVPRTLYAVAGGSGGVTVPRSVFKSTDAGTTWGAADMGLPSSGVIALAIDQVTPSTLYAGTYVGSAVFKSTNAGTTWGAVIAGLIPNTAVRVLAIDPIAPTTLYAGISFEPDGKPYSGGVFKSTDATATWATTGLTTGPDTIFSIGAVALAIDPVTPTTLYAVTNDGGVAKSTDAGATWAATSLTTRVVALAINPTSPTTLYAGRHGFKIFSTQRAAVGGGVFKSTDAGATWSATGLVDTWVAAVVLDPTRPSTLYATSGVAVFKSTDAGATWTDPSPTRSSIECLPGVSALAIDPVMPRTLYAVTYGGLFKSTDAGTTWGATGLTVAVNALVIDPFTSTTLYAGTNDGVFKSTDGGAAWRALNEGLTNASAFALAIDPVTPRILYAGTSSGVSSIEQVAGCHGDCDASSSVSIDELITLVNIALGTAQPSACPQGVPNGAAVDIALIIRAVNSALNGCPRSVPIPNIEGPITGGTGTPLIASTTFDLADVGYAQSEYFISGMATAYTNIGPLAVDGLWTVAARATAAYKTRILAYRPIDSARFNGTVIVEWLNVTGGRDAAPDWIMGHTELIRAGFAWVGVSAQVVGVEGGPEILPGLTVMSLKTTDPQRYGSLNHPGDSFSYDIFSQAGQVIRHAAVSPLGDLHVEAVIAAGESQSAFRMVTYINAVHPLADVYDGFLVHSRGGPGYMAPLSEAPQPAIAVPDTAHIRSDLDVPVLTFETEGDLIVFASGRVRQPDSDRFRLWEVAGTAHADAYESVVGVADQGDSPDAANLVITATPLAWPAPLTLTPEFTCGVPINSGPQHFVLNAAIAALNEWVRHGTLPAVAPRLNVRVVEPVTVARDANGNAVNGIRTPQVDVPIAMLSGGGQGGTFFCQLFGTTVPFDAAKLASLYPDHESYVSQFNEATDRAVEAGFILPPDATLMKAAAAASGIGG